MDEELEKTGLTPLQRSMRDNGIENAEKIVFRNLHIQERSIKVNMRAAPEGETPSRYDEITGTAVIASTTPVQREIWVPGEGYRIVDEVLLMEGVRLERAGILPLLKDHVSWRVDNQIGDWSNVRVDPQDSSQMLADFRISGDDDNQTFCHRFARGYIKTFSCAYTVDGTVQEETNGKITLRINAWTLYEISAVAVPADYRSTARSFGNLKLEGVRTMEDELDQDGNPITIQTGPSADDEDGNGGGNEAVRQSDDALRARAKDERIPGSFVRNFLGTSATPDQMSNKWQAHQANQRSRETADLQGNPSAPISIDGSRTAQARTIARAFAKTDSARAKGVQIDLGAEYQSIVPDLSQGLDARGLLRLAAKRHNVRLPQDINENHFTEIRSLAPMVIADFKWMLELAINMGEISEREVIPYWGDGIVRPVEFTSFQAGRFTLPPIWDELIPTKPGSEVKGGGIKIYDTMATMETLNRVYPIARQLWEGSGTGMFTNYNADIRNAAIIGANKQLQRKILSNPTMSDGFPFFHGSRNNVATNVPLTIEGLGQIQAATFRDGAGVPFTIVIANPANLTVLRQLNSAPAAAKVGDVNPFGGTFRVVPMPGFPVNATMWLTDPRIIAAFFRMQRSGQTVPLMKLIESERFDGFSLMAAKDEGVAHGDPRGAFLAFTGDEPEFLPNGRDEANYEALDIADLLELLSEVDWDGPPVNAAA